MSMLSCILYKYKCNSERKRAFFAFEHPNCSAKSKMYIYHNITCTNFNCTKLKLSAKTKEIRL